MRVFNDELKIYSQETTTSPSKWAIITSLPNQLGAGAICVLCVSHWEFGYSSNSKFHYHMHASRCSHYHPFTSHHQPSIISHIVWTFLVGRKFHFTSLSWHANALSVQSSATLEDISAPELRHFCNIATSIRRCRILPPHV